MHFIFPKNYDFKPKLFGFINYSSAILNIIFLIIVFTLLHFFPISLLTRLSIMIAICFPVFLLSTVVFNGEDFVFVFWYTFRFYIKQKLFFYSIF